MKNLVLFFVFLLSLFTVKAQNIYFTKSGNISFASIGSLENIEAQHKSVTCVLDTKTGNLQFEVLMKGFEFKKAAMQEHFNEDYVESNKYKKAEFKGLILNNNDVLYNKDGTYTVKVKGKLTMHGETKDVEAKGNISIKAGKVQTNSTFNVQLSDYKIEIPTLVKDNISNNVRIDVNCSLEQLKS